jgi:hypothetical protein
MACKRHCAFRLPANQVGYIATVGFAAMKERKRIFLGMSAFAALRAAIAAIPMSHYGQLLRWLKWSHNVQIGLAMALLPPAPPKPKRNSRNGKNSNGYALQEDQSFAS